MLLVKNSERWLILVLIIANISSSAGYVSAYSVMKNNFINQSEKNLIDDYPDLEMKDYGFSEEINLCISKIKYDIDEYEATKNIVNLRRAMVLFGDFPLYIEGELEEGDIDIYYKNDIFKDIFFEIRDLIYEIDASIAVSLLEEFGEEIFFGWRKNKHVISYALYYLDVELREYNIGKLEGAQSKLNYLSSLVDYFISYKDEEPNSEEFPQIDELPDVDGGDSGGEEDIPPIIYPDWDLGEPELPPIENENEESKLESTEKIYKKEGKSCFIIERRYSHGNLISENKKEAPISEYINCGISDYLVGNLNSNSGIVIDEDYINSNQNEDSNKYIYYTVTKNKLYPYYYNSNIKATKEEIVSYNQLKDALYQCAMKSKGFSTDANDKSLTIIEGKPIVLDSAKDIYTVKDLNDICENLNTVGLVIKDGDVDNGSIYEDIVNSKFVLNFKDREIVVGAKPKVKGSDIYVSMIELLDIVEVKYEIKNEIVKLDIENKKIEIDKNKNTILIDGVVSALAQNSENVGNIFYINIEFMLNIIGYNIYYDSENTVFNIEKK